MCAGNSLITMMRAKRDARISDYFDLVSLILNTFGSANPYCYIEHWIGEVCRECGTYYVDHKSAQANPATCEECLQTYCNICVIQPCCANIAKVLCGPCKNKTETARCVYCSQWICNECETKCERCNAKYCTVSTYNCATEHRC